ncbi:hypothetical protein [Falsarthrobacter nasiphocae]|uniref:Uncharacterized protein n=1 Tax=Falsarthrobacter nasiphocae TaxID=189863 RepID=A0AAE3YFZ1_9MICC|nr:hypothetical protein [Falsarthrobacter nasiphocae]MDR6892455.1 hypothetical protein [Falsarthrobacter nasiphocae]
MTRRADALRERWKRTSLAREWRVPEDWGCPATETLPQLLVERRDVTEVMEELGRHRARIGVGIAEALADLFALFDSCSWLATPGCEHQRRYVAAYADAWADESLGYSPAISCVDPATGLATFPHFSRRLEEMYDDAARPLDKNTVLAAITTDAVGRSVPAHERAALLGEKAQETFEPLGGLSTLAHGTLLAVFVSGPETMARLHELVTWIRESSDGRSPIRASIEPLPCRREQLAGLLEPFR